MRHFVVQEQLSVSVDDVNAEIARMVSSVDSEQATWFQQFLSTPQSRQNIGADLMTNRAVKRLAAIARGENPPVGDAAPDAAAPAEQAAALVTEPAPAAEETPNS
jgi:hypothetical protein